MASKALCLASEDGARSPAPWRKCTSGRFHPSHRNAAEVRSGTMMAWVLRACHRIRASRGPFAAERLPVMRPARPRPGDLRHGHRAGSHRRSHCAQGGGGAVVGADAADRDIRMAQAKFCGDRREMQDLMLPSDEYEREIVQIRHALIDGRAFRARSFCPSVLISPFGVTCR